MTSHTRPDGISHAQWHHMQGAEISMETSGARASDEGISAHALRSIAHSLMALTALLTDHLPHRDPVPADLPPIPPQLLAQYRMSTPDGEPDEWRPIRNGMWVQSLGGHRYEFRTIPDQETP